jgi:hypothetical protein
MICFLITNRVNANKIDKQPKALREKIEGIDRAFADYLSLVDHKIVCIGGVTENKNNFVFIKKFIAIFKCFESQLEASKPSTYFETVIFQT